jgi:hypothetical protein
MKSIEEIITEELLQQNLFEVGEANLKPYPYTKDQDKDDINVNYYFDTEDQDHYIVHISESYEGVSVDFKALGYSEDDLGMGGYAKILNKGRMYRIFSTLAKIIKEYAQEYDPKTIEIEPLKSKEVDQRRYNIYMAFIKKNLPNNYYMRYEDPKIVIRKKQSLGQIREVQDLKSSKKLYYHGRSKSRPYTGKYIFITDNLGYAAGYSDSNYLYVYTIPFSQDKIFSIKDPRHKNLLSKYIDGQAIIQILNDSGPQSEIDWATLPYISNDEYDTPEDLLEHLGFYGVRLKERQGIDSIYIFNQDTLDYQGTIDTNTPEMRDKIGKFYRDFAKDKNFLEEMKNESLADKYAEKQFGIQDPNVQQDLQAKSAIQKDLEKPHGFAKDMAYTGSGLGSSHVAIYKNPKSLENFDSDVRAIGTISGNLYVAQKNAMMMHGQMGEYIHLDNSQAIYSGKYLLLYRDGNTNNFILSDTAEEDYPKYWQYFNDIIKNIETINPQYRILASIDHDND